LSSTSFGDWLIADKSGKPVGRTKKEEINMPVLDSAIAYYLCGIMVVLGLIIVAGAIRQKKNGVGPR
jgi:hypothetical protein